MNADGFIRFQSTELVFLENELANLGSRALAFVVDMAIRMVVIVVMLIAIGWARLTESGFTLLAMTLVSLVYLSYHIVFESTLDGKTPGKSFAGVRVIKSDGTRLSLLDVVIRNVLRIVDILPFGYILGMVLVFFDPSNRRMGDLVAHTVVIHDRPTRQSMEAFLENRLMSAAPNKSIIITGIGRLTPEERDVAKKLYARMGSIDESGKERILKRFTETYSRKLTFKGSEDPEVLLYELYKRI